MRSAPNLKAEKYRILGPPNENVGAFMVPVGRGWQLRIIICDGGGWDHVSVSMSSRCPTWQEMCQIKELFFRDDEAVFQLHPARDEHVNCHPNCLHLWRPQTDAEIAVIRANWGEEWIHDELQSAGVIPLPPKWMVGPQVWAAECDIG